MQINEYNKRRRKDFLKIGGIMLGHLGVLNAAAILITVVLTVIDQMTDIAAMEFMSTADGMMIVNIIANICGNVIFMGIIWLIFRKKTVLPEKKGRMSIILPICMLLVLQVNLLVSSTDQVISELTNFHPEGNVSELMAGGSFWVMLITVGIIGPIIEEFAFRKVLFTLTRGYGFRFAAVISAAMFALMHQNITQFFFAFLMGLLFAYVYEMSGKLIFPIILHVFNNSYAVVMSFVPMSGWVYAGMNLVLLISFAILAVMFLIKKKSMADFFPARGDEKRTIKELFTRPTVIIYSVLCLETALITMFIPM